MIDENIPDYCQSCPHIYHGSCPFEDDIECIKYAEKGGDINADLL